MDEISEMKAMLLNDSSEGRFCNSLVLWLLSLMLKELVVRNLVQRSV